MQLSVRNAAQRSAHLILAERALNDQSTAHPHSHLPSTEEGTELACEEEPLIQAGSCRSWKAEGWTVLMRKIHPSFPWYLGVICSKLYQTGWLAQPTYFCASHRKMATKRCQMNTTAVIDHLHRLLQQNVITRFAVLFVVSSHHGPISIQIATLHMWPHWWGMSLAHPTASLTSWHQQAHFSQICCTRMAFARCQLADQKHNKWSLPLLELLSH